MGKAIAADFGRLLGLALVLSVAVGLLLTAAAVAVPEPLACGESVLPRCEQPKEAQSGSFYMRRGHDQPWTSAPALETEVSVRVSGVVARAKVIQRFRNGSDEWVEGIYVFPLPPQSAVDHLLMRVGERTIEGQIREREQARAEYEQAKASGRKTSLVEQERPNVFTTSVANLGPGEELVVEIELQETLELDEGEVRLRFPLVVGEGPRPAVRIEVELDAGFPVETLGSRYHPILSERRDERRYRVRLRDELVPADRDFELFWRPRPGTMPRGAVFVEERGGSTYALLTLFPPRLSATLENPVLTGIEVSWPTGAAVESWPQRLGDLHLGEPLSLSARFDGRPAAELTVRGRRLNEPWSARLPLAAGPSEGVAVLWAQRKVRALQDSTHDGADPEQVRAEIVALGLEHHLVTPHTSLVAVDVTSTRPENAALRSAAVPTSLPHGSVLEPQWGALPQTAPPAPLHATITLIALVLAALTKAARRPRPAKRTAARPGLC